jgi:hypothetical protein
MKNEKVSAVFHFDKFCYAISDESYGRITTGAFSSTDGGLNIDGTDCPSAFSAVAMPTAASAQQVQITRVYIRISA